MTNLPNIQILQHESILLWENPMRDPHIRHLPVYIPPGYDSKRKEPYPTVYLLSGWSGRGSRYLNDEGVFSKSLPALLDELILAKKFEPVVVIFPDGGTRLGCSQYINSISNGPYMDYLCDEIVPFVDANFHTHKNPLFRGIAGHSSGGFGALVTGMLRPDCFLYVCSSAGDSWYEYLYTHSIPSMIRVLEKDGGVQTFIEKFLQNPNPLGLLPRDHVETMMNLSICACFSPNLSIPLLKGDLYFDVKTGERISEVWKKFLAWDPVYMIDKNIANLRKLQWIHLEAGTEDEYSLHIGHRQIAKKLKTYEIDYVLDEYPGKHGGHHYRFGDRFQKMVKKMYSSSENSL